MAGGGARADQRPGAAGPHRDRHVRRGGRPPAGVGRVAPGACRPPPGAAGARPHGAPRPRASRAHLRAVARHSVRADRVTVPRRRARPRSVRAVSTRQPQTPARADALRLVSARSLDPADLVSVFNLGFSDYLVPMVMDEAGLSDHIAHNDIDLGCSRVATDVEPVGFALVARRGTEAWIGGMGTAPAYRRIGLGARTLAATIAAAADRGTETGWLEGLGGKAAAVSPHWGPGCRG